MYNAYKLAQVRSRELQSFLLSHSLALNMVPHLSAVGRGGSKESGTRTFEAKRREPRSLFRYEERDVGWEARILQCQKFKQ
jgi:hypothetical protein